MVRHDGLAINDGRANFQSRQGLRNARHAVRPVVPPPRVDANVALIDYAHRPVAIMLDLVQPVRAGRGRAHERRQAGCDPGRGKVEEAGLAKVGPGADDAAGDALWLRVSGALDCTRLSWLLRHAISPALDRQHFTISRGGTSCAVRHYSNHIALLLP
jgi:hypothetical protein